VAHRAIWLLHSNQGRFGGEAEIDFGGVDMPRSIARGVTDHLGMVFL
jgi:hypothetical protein